MPASRTHALLLKHHGRPLDRAGQMKATPGRGGYRKARGVTEAMTGEWSSRTRKKEITREATSSRTDS